MYCVLLNIVLQYTELCLCILRGPLRFYNSDIISSDGIDGKTADPDYMYSHQILYWTRMRGHVKFKKLEACEVAHLHISMFYIVVIMDNPSERRIRYHALYDCMIYYFTRIARFQSATIVPSITFEYLEPI